MTLEEKVRADLLAASKEGNALAQETLRGLLASLHNEVIRKRSSGKEEELSDEETLSLLSRETKKRKESLEIFKKAGRDELARKEEQELSILEEYLPPQMSEEEIKSKIDEVIKEIEPSGPQDFGKVMGVLMRDLRGRADSALVGKFLKEKLE